MAGSKRVKGITFGRPEEVFHSEEAVACACRRVMGSPRKFPNAKIEFDADGTARLSYDPTPENIHALLD